MSFELVRTSDSVPIEVRGEEGLDLKVEFEKVYHESNLCDVVEKQTISPKNSTVVLSWKNLSVSTKNSNPDLSKALIKNLNGTIAGGFWAIMGASGSGKTTFLSALARRIDTFRMVVEGEILMNGRPYSNYDLKKMSGYVMQDDLIHAHLTVGETLMYTSELRMAAGSTYKQRMERQEYVMNLLGIRYCRNIIVGDTRHKGISGGERKRLCIAMELLTHPSLLFLDEPTSGLDSATALAVVSTLKEIAASGECTVVTTIHQPQTKIYALFDNLILMRHGEFVYQGQAIKATEYFGTIGFPCPPQTNPADHLIDIVCDNDVYQHKLSEDQLNEKAERLRIIDSKKFSVAIDPNFGGTSSMIAFKEFQPWYHQFWALFRRNLLSHYRNWYIFVTNVFVTLLIASFVCLSVWKDIGHSKSSVPKRQPLLFFCVIHQGIVASLQGTHSFPLERSIVLRERSSGAYYVSAYFLSKTLSDMLVQLPMPIIFTCIVYPISGLQPQASKFFIFMVFMILDAFCATSLANVISCIFVSIEFSTVVLAMAYEWVRLFGGWFISPKQISLYPEWKFADALSYLKYAFVGVSLNENNGLVLYCKPNELNSAGACVMPPLTNPPYAPPYTGEEFNEYYGYNRYTIGTCILALCVYIISCRVLAYLGLRYIKI